MIKKNKKSSLHYYKITSLTNSMQFSQRSRCLILMIFSNLSSCLYLVTLCLLQQSKQKANQPRDLLAYLASFLSDAGKY